MKEIHNHHSKYELGKSYSCIIACKSHKKINYTKQISCNRINQEDINKNQIRQLILRANS